jgi:shikimate kinase
MKISLLGYMASGKSTLGRALAESLGLPFKDLDQLIEARTESSVSELILNKGELYFRNLEREILLETLAEDNFVLALGGGTPCYFDNMAVLNSNSVTVYLERSISDLYNVLAIDRRERPLIAHLAKEDLKEFIAKHLFERREFYEQAIFKIPQEQKGLNERLETLKNYLQ